MSKQLGVRGSIRETTTHRPAVPEQRRSSLHRDRESTTSIFATLRHPRDHKEPLYASEYYPTPEVAPTDQPGDNGNSRCKTNHRKDYPDEGDDVLTDHTSAIQDSSKASHLLQGGIRGKR